MKFSKISTCIAFGTLTSLAAASCGGDDDTTSSGAGRGGSGGKSGRGGMSGGHAGRVAAGEAGGGASGTDAGATGGSGGVAGTAGTDAAGGTGAEAGDGSATGGAGAGTAGEGPGGAGAGGETAADLMQCALGCESEDDCSSQTAEARHCDPDSKRCVECNTHLECIPVASAWSSSCVMDDDCFVDFGEVCVDVAGRGHCAAKPDETLGCLFPGEIPLTLPKFGGSPSDTVEVCGKDAGRCENHACFTGCTDGENYCTSGLTMGYGDTCDAASGRCACEDDSECKHGPEHCNTTTHRCDECGNADDCPGVGEGQDACVNGRCGCSSESVCSNMLFPASTSVCE